MYKYYAKIIDRLTGETMRRTRYYTTWEAAQKQAEKRCKQLFGTNDRYEVKVI